MPLLVLDATGMRVGELERLTWGDVDEPRGRWRVSKTVAKTGYGRWVTRSAGTVRRGARAVPRDDRHPHGACSKASSGDRLRTAIRRACTAAGVPTSHPMTYATGGSACSTWAACRGRRIGEEVGQRDLAVTANTYSHVLTDERELDYRALV